MDELGNGYSDDTEYEEVQTMCLDDLITKALSVFGTKTVDLLKVDCEGSEYDFLIDQDLSKVDAIVLELHNWLDCEPSNDNDGVTTFPKNKKWHLLEHISKTHDITAHNHLTESDMVIPLKDRHGIHSMVRWDRRDTPVAMSLSGKHKMINERFDHIEKIIK